MQLKNIFFLGLCPNGKHPWTILFMVLKTFIYGRILKTCSRICLDSSLYELPWAIFGKRSLRTFPLDNFSQSDLVFLSWTLLFYTENWKQSHTKIRDEQKPRYMQLWNHTLLIHNEFRLTKRGYANALMSSFLITQFLKPKSLSHSRLCVYVGWFSFCTLVHWIS